MYIEAPYDYALAQQQLKKTRQELAKAVVANNVCLKLEFKEKFNRLQGDIKRYEKDTAKRAKIKQSYETQVEL